MKKAGKRLAGLLLCGLCLACGEDDCRRIAYVSSYHEGYAPGDEIRAAIEAKTAEKGDSLKVIYMDCKRNPSEAYARSRAEQIDREIRRFAPDGIVMSDDDAVKYVAVPYYRDRKIPVSFCGVNWDCTQYGLPAGHITGVLEVLPLDTLLMRMKKKYPAGRRLAVLSENTVSERNNRELLDTLYRRYGWEPEYFLVDDFNRWKEAFVQVNRDFDLIYLPTNGAVKGWDDRVAREWVFRHIGKPVVTCDDFMMPYCVYGLTKVAGEQGERAVRILYEMMEGNKEAQEIPVEKNSRHTSRINRVLADKAGFGLQPADEDETNEYK